MADVVVIDSGGANLASLLFALRRQGVAAGVSTDAARIRAASHVLLPGVGAAHDAMARLRATGIDRLLPTLAQPVLGICLGMQLLFEASEEAAQNRLPAAAADLGDSLRHVRTLAEGAGTGAEIVEIFEAELPDQAVQALARDLSFLFVDRDELDALVSSFPEQLSPDLLTVWRTRLHERA